ncbi:Hypothetical protein R9X50_00625100 [Acrodontium crateriforme]|uniref:ribonuclease Z n=1 Tax=Acrodontium crateriforme TaxID=150365 RepID=A0AAQ3M7L1_9PEZI|nr:Hypothetical protein R9X50_00625100 [Acrodontium crateriforme]
MKSHVQILTTPTADTPGTSLLLHFDNKRYLIGSLAEGTQRSCIQMGARMLKVGQCFITGRTEWKNMGGLIGMILTLADAAAASRQSNHEEAKKKALIRAKKLGVQNDHAKLREFEEEIKKEQSTGLTLFAPPNTNHFLATARRFVFRRGLPINVHEIDESQGKFRSETEWAPYWADDNVKVWAMSIKPSSSQEGNLESNISTGTVSPRKRSFEEMHAQSNSSSGLEDSLSLRDRHQLTTKAVVSEMFSSNWRLDTLYETPLSQVKLPATVFVRNTETHKIEKYTGPLPGDGKPMDHPDITVLVRKPWPGAMIESLPHTEPAKEAVSYIIRNHVQRGKFHTERAEALKVPKGPAYAELAKGNSVTNTDGETITPEMVLGESKEGGGLAVIDLPDASYIEPLLARPEWREPAVMAGVGAIVWLCGKGVATDSRLHAFMEDFSKLEHVVSSPEHCPNHISLDSVAASTIRLRRVDPKRYEIPAHKNEPLLPPTSLPKGVHVAHRGQYVELEPAIKISNKLSVPNLDVAATESEMAEDVVSEGLKAQEAAAKDEEAEKWASTLPPGAKDAEVITLGTGSALPSKYRNVSATLVRVPGWGNVLFDCGENTLGQLKRVFQAEELRQVLKDLKILVISHMHADHHLGTVGVVKAWYEIAHKGQPLPEGVNAKSAFAETGGLAIMAEPAMMQWLKEYAFIEDYGYSRIAPIYVTAPRNQSSELGWFVAPSELAGVSAHARSALLAANKVAPSFVALTDFQAAAVKHCHGARAVSLTFPSGFKASYSGDCRPSRAFAEIGKGSTVCIHEATFDDELQGDAQAKNHSTTSEALSVAQAMNARACVLTHFSQRYQKLPVLERGSEDQAIDILSTAEDEDTDENATGPIESGDGPPRPADPMEGVAPTLPNQNVSGAGEQYTLPPKSSATLEAVKFKLTTDMKVAVAFDYMRVKVGEIPELEKFTPALLKLFAEEETNEDQVEVNGLDEKTSGKKNNQKSKGGGNGNGNGKSRSGGKGNGKGNAEKKA